MPYQLSTVGHSRFSISVCNGHFVVRLAGTFIPLSRIRVILIMAYVPRAEANILSEFFMTAVCSSLVLSLADR